MAQYDPPAGDTSYQDASLALAERSAALAEEQWAWMQEQAAIKEANVAEGFAEIKALFEGREPLYRGLAEQVSALNNPELHRLHSDAQRLARFKLAGAGTLGGSAEADVTRRQAERLALGMGRVETFAQGQADQLKAQDEGMRSSLMGLAATGAVSGQQLSGQATSALQGLKGSAQYLPGLGQTFSGTANNIGAARGQLSGPAYGPMMAPPKPGYQGARAY